MEDGTTVGDRVLRVLRERPKGLTITEIAKQIGATRNTVSKHLDILLVAGRVESVTIGNAKLFSTANRVPLSGFLCFTHSMILVLDSDHNIINVNDRFLEHFNLKRKYIIGLNLMESDLPLLSSEERIAEIKALKKERVRSEIISRRDGEDYYYTMDVIRTIFEDGEKGITILLDDITERKRWEIALKKSEEKYRRLVENLKHEMLFVLDTSGAIQHISSNTEPMAGYSLPEIQCRRYIDYVHPDDRALAADHFLRTLEKPVDPIDFRLMKNNGSGYLWVRSYANPTYKDGKLTGCHCIIIDITSLKEREAELIRSNRLLEGVLDGVSDILAIQNPDHSIIRYNKAGYEAFGIPYGEVDGCYCYTSLGRSKPCEICASNRALKSKTIEMVERYVPELGQHYICRTAPILDDAGEVQILVEQLTNITRHKKLEESLRESNEYLNNLINHANVPIIVWNRDYIITRFNHAFEKMTAILAEEVIGQNIELLFPEDSRKSLMELITHSMDGESLNSVEIPIIDRVGTTHIVLMSSAKIMEKNYSTIHSVIAQGQDITEQKRFINSMEFLTKTALDLADLEKKADIFQYVVEAISGFVPGVRANIFSYDSKKEELNLVALLNRQFREEIERLVGWDCTDLRISLGDQSVPSMRTRYAEMVDTPIREYHVNPEGGEIQGDLYDLLSGIVPEEIYCDFLKSQNISTIYVMNLVSNENLLGSIWFYLSPGEAFIERYAIESFLRKVSLFIEKIRSEEERERSVRQLHEVITSLPLASAIINRNGSYDFLNVRFTELFGYTLDDIPTGRDWFSRAFPDHVYRREAIDAWKNDLNCYDRGSARLRTFRVRCKNGDDKLIFFRPVRLSDGSDFVIYQDMTEDRKIYDLLIGEIAGLRLK